MDNNKNNEDFSEQKTGNNDRDKFYNKTSDKSASDKFEALDNWLKVNGAVYPSLELRDYGVSEVRGCHALDDINPDETIIKIPLKCLITVEMGKETEIGKLILASNIELDAPKHIFLMIFMLIDRKNMTSFFRPYYDILPESLNNMPIFWTVDELNYLSGSYLLTQIEERVSAIEADYTAICNLYPKFYQIASMEDFKWARMCVCSRNFGLVINGVKTAALVPYADMLNHYRPRETKWQFDDAVQGFTVTTIESIQAGAQVYDSYGQKCNHRFLLNYGFSIENNVELDGYCPNEVPIFLQLKRSDPLYEEKLAIWRRDSSFPSRRIRISLCDNENFRILFAMLRIIEADQEDINTLLRIVSNSSTNINPSILMTFRSVRDAFTEISRSNEYRVLCSMEAICNDCLSKYPNSYESDCQRLKSDALAPFSNERHAVIQVKGEKEILLFLRDLAITGKSFLMLQDLKVIDSELKRLSETKNSIIYQYFQSVLYKLILQDRRDQFYNDKFNSRSILL